MGWDDLTSDENSIVGTWDVDARPPIAVAAVARQLQVDRVGTADTVHAAVSPTPAPSAPTLTDDASMVTMSGTTSMPRRATRSGGSWALESVQMPITRGTVTKPGEKRVTIVERSPRGRFPVESSVFGELEQPAGHAHRSALLVHATVHRDGRGAHLVAHGEQVRHLERGPGGGTESKVHHDLVVEAQRLSVLHECFEHGVVDALLAQLGVRMAEMAQVLDPGLLQIGQVAAVVDDAHRIGLGETDSQPMVVRVVVGDQAGFQFEAHSGTVPPEIARFGVGNILCG